MQLDDHPGEGRAGAFEHLFLSFGPKVRTMLLRRGADPAAADDIARQVMLAAWQTCDLPEDPVHLSTSIYRAARDTSTRQFRKQMIWQGESDPNIAAPSLLDGYLSGGLDRLSPDQLQVVSLSLIDGLSQKEIAARLKISLSAVQELMRTTCDQFRDTAECP